MKGEKSWDWKERLSAEFNGRPPFPSAEGRGSQMGGNEEKLLSCPLCKKGVSFQA